MSKLVGLFSVFLLGFCCTFSANAQLSDAAAWASTVQNDFRVISDITYRQANGVELKIDVYQSRNDEGPAPTFIYYHGGGWVGGDLDTHDPLCRAIADMASCLVIAVDYRLAPEHKYPAAVDDARAAFQWVCDYGPELGIPPGSVAIGGDSAGGNLAAVVSLMARDQQHPLPCLQVLLYPIVDSDFTTNSYQQYAEGYLLTASGMKWFRQHYLPDETLSRQPYASPLQADDLSGLPPALVITAEYDVLRDDCLLYTSPSPRDRG